MSGKFNLIMGEHFAIIETKNNDKCIMYKTDLFFGDVIAELENKYPEMVLNPSSWEKYILNDIYSESPVLLWGMAEGCSALSNIYKFIDNRRVIDISLIEAERMRTEYKFNSFQHNEYEFDYPLPDEQSVYFRDLETITQVLFASLCYYAMEGYKLVRCKHCGKWFATKTLKEQYSKHISPCYNMVVAGKKVLSSKLTCEQAVRCILQKFRDRKKCIYNNWYVNRDGDFCNNLLKECGSYVDAIKTAPTVENICAYQEYLYSNKMPKQERPNRRSNSHMRGVIGK